ncbi:MAG: hypothetical protein AAF135_14040 [Bacteroidota bacterium]
MNFLKSTSLLSIFSRYLLAEFILYIPSVDELTAISKFLVQIVLLATGLFELRRNWKRSKQKRQSIDQVQDSDVCEDG